MIPGFLNVNLKSQIVPDSYCFLKFDVSEQNYINFKLLGYLGRGDVTTAFSVVVAY